MRADGLAAASIARCCWRLQQVTEHQLRSWGSRVELLLELRSLGAAVGGPGALFDVMAGRARDSRLPAPVILEVLLEALGPIWPNRQSLAGVPLGDCWTSSGD